MLRIPTALLLLSPAIASAQCLTAEALDTGITVEYGSGSTSYFQRTDYGTIIDAHYDVSDYDYYGQIVLFETIDGVFEARRDTHRKDTWESDDDVGMDYNFEVELARPYAVGTRGNGVLTVLDSRYGPNDVSFGWSTYESDPLVVGECRYEAVRVFTTEFSLRRGEVYTREIKYLPELGFGIQVGNSYYSMPASNGDIVSMGAS